MTADEAATLRGWLRCQREAHAAVKGLLERLFPRGSTFTLAGVEWEVCGVSLDARSLLVRSVGDRRVHRALPAEQLAPEPAPQPPAGVPEYAI